MEFKDYKEKQKYYKNLSQPRCFWVSSENKKNKVVKGRTYIKARDNNVR